MALIFLKIVWMCPLALASIGLLIVPLPDYNSMSGMHNHHTLKYNAIRIKALADILQISQQKRKCVFHMFPQGINIPQGAYFQYDNYALPFLL